MRKFKAICLHLFKLFTREKMSHPTYVCENCFSFVFNSFILLNRHHHHHRKQLSEWDEKNKINYKLNSHSKSKKNSVRFLSEYSFFKLIQNLINLISSFPSVYVCSTLSTHINAHTRELKKNYFHLILILPSLFFAHTWLNKCEYFLSLSSFFNCETVKWGVGGDEKYVGHVTLELSIYAHLKTKRREIAFDEVPHQENKWW